MQHPGIFLPLPFSGTFHRLFSIFVIVQLFQVKAQVQDFKCPPPTEIFPCTCEVNAKGENVTCAGDLISQESVNQCFQAIRLVNNISTSSSPTPGGQSGWLYLHEFSLHSTVLTEFDWTPVSGSRIEILDVKHNPKLSKLIGPPLTSIQDKIFNLGSIEVNSLAIRDNPLLNDEGLGQTFRYFSHALQSIDLRRNALTGSATVTSGAGQQQKRKDDRALSRIEFLPGFSALSNLVYLDLAQNKIEKVAGGQFRRNSKLSILYLSNNPIEEIGEDAFLIDDVDSSDLDDLEAGAAAKVNRTARQNNNSERRIIVSLFNNSMHEEMIHEANGLERYKGRAYLNLEFNRVTTLSQSKFQPFLDAQPGHTINLFENPLICDENLLWLRNQTEKYVQRVRFAECRNDPGQTIFTTNIFSQL